MDRTHTPGIAGPALDRFDCHTHIWVWWSPGFSVSLRSWLSTCGTASTHSFRAVEGKLRLRIAVAQTGEDGVVLVAEVVSQEPALDVFQEFELFLAGHIAAARLPFHRGCTRPCRGEAPREIRLGGTVTSR